MIGFEKGVFLDEGFWVSDATELESFWRLE